VHAKLAALVESHFTDAAFPLFDQATMPAGVALKRIASKMLGQLGRTFGSQIIEDLR
jgi:hypothetical protein